MKSDNIALLIRDPQQIGNCLSSIDYFCRSNAKIRIILLEAAHACHHPQWICRLEALAGPGVECYADAPGEMQAHGFQVVETAQIAQLLAQADMVITL